MAATSRAKKRSTPSLKTKRSEAAKKAAKTRKKNAAELARKRAKRSEAAKKAAKTRAKNAAELAKKRARAAAKGQETRRRKAQERARRSEAAKRGAKVRASKARARSALETFRDAVEARTPPRELERVKDTWRREKHRLQVDVVDVERYLEILDDIADEAGVDWDIGYGSTTESAA